jgi:hypothetical protein
MTESIDITKQRHGVFWIAMGNAQKGDRIVYHIGEHCAGPHRKDAAKAHQDGKCLLFCKRVKESQFAYFAIKR